MVLQVEQLQIVVVGDQSPNCLWMMKMMMMMILMMMIMMMMSGDISGP